MKPRPRASPSRSKREATKTDGNAAFPSVSSDLRLTHAADPKGISMQIKAAVLRQTGAPLCIERIEIEQPHSDEVLVRVRATGICHTDLEVIRGQVSCPLPAVLGHETAGVVEAIGAGVTHVRKGDHVVLSWNPHCGHCFYCDDGQPILCEEYTALQTKGTTFDGTTRLSHGADAIHQLMFLGGFAEYCVVPKQSVVRITPDIPFDRACLIGCGVMTGFGAATRVAQVKYGTSVAIFGCGAVGLSAVQGARMSGAASVIAVDLDDKKLNLAMSLGATYAVNATREEAADVIKKVTGGRGADYVFEAAGNAQAFRATLESVRPGGQVVWLGKLPLNQEISFRWGSLMKEKQIIRSSYGGARAQSDFVALALSYLEGALKLDELITRRISLDEINDGFEALAKGEVIRSVVMFPE